MANWFIRQQGKVFGPFSTDRFRDFLNAKKFEAAAEFGESWEGPWDSLDGALEKLRKATIQESLQGPPKAPSPGDAPPHSVVRHPPVGDGEANPLDTPTLIGEIDDEAFFASIPNPATAPPPRATRRTDKLFTSAVRSVIAVVSAAGVLVLLLMFLSTSRNERSGDSLASTQGLHPSARRSNDDAWDSSGAERTASSRPVARPTTMTTTKPDGNASPSPGRPERPRLPADRTDAANDASRARNPSPAVRNPTPESRYDSLPPDALQAIKAIRTLRAIVELGTSFDHYSAKVQELLPSVRLFLESREAASVPELATLLKNASDCYVEVRNIWNDSIFASPVLRKHDATRLLAEARDPLFKLAGDNVDLAYSLASDEAAKREEALRRASSALQDLEMAPCLRAIKGRLSAELGSLAEKSPPSSDPSPAPEPRPTVEPSPRRPKVLPARLFNAGEIDVAELRKMAGLLREEELSKEDADLIDDLLNLTTLRKWSLRDGNSSRGDVVTIWPDAVRLRTDEGDGRVRRDRLSPLSAKIVARIVELAESLHALQGRLAAADDAQ
jgi:hypothetical protein